MIIGILIGSLHLGETPLQRIEAVQSVLSILDERHHRSTQSTTTTGK